VHTGQFRASVEPAKGTGAFSGESPRALFDMQIGHRTPRQLANSGQPDRAGSIDPPLSMRPQTTGTQNFELQALEGKETPAVNRLSQFPTHPPSMSMFRAKKLDIGSFLNIGVIRDHTKRKVFAEHEPERCVARSNSYRPPQNISLPWL
jgi:hypothetical protein